MFQSRMCWRRVCATAMIAMAFAGASAPASAATLPAGFSETLVASGLSSPTAMQFAPDGRLFVCQQGGALRVIKNGALLTTPFLTVSVDQNGERGLLGVAFDPNFASNQYVYIYYTVPGGGAQPHQPLHGQRGCGRARERGRRRGPRQPERRDQPQRRRN
jgi:glucose/arabinose dehydrogenase